MILVKQHDQYTIYVIGENVPGDVPKDVTRDGTVRVVTS